MLMKEYLIVFFQREINLLHQRNHLKDVLEQRMSVVKDRAYSWACWMQAVQYLWRWDAKGDPDENLAKAQELISFMRDALHKEKARGSTNG